MKFGLGVAALALVGAVLAAPVVKVAASSRPNVIIIVSDDQRWDKVTAKYTPHIWQLAYNPTAVRPSAQSIVFANSFVSNPLCCPSRTTILSGKYSHTTGVWNNGEGNGGAYGGFSVFDDKHTLPVDFHQQGYRTALIGKYLNGYRAGHNRYVPPGWGRWFATNTGAYYNWGVTTQGGTHHYGSRPKDYSTRVMARKALDFITKPVAAPFFLYLSFSAPHGPAVPDVRDVGRFKGEPDWHYRKSTRPSSALDSAYGIDRAVGQLLAVVPANTIIIYISDNGLQWNDATIRGNMIGKLWPYNESIRVPIIYSSLNGVMPNATVDDIVANVDLRTTLLHAVGLAPLTSQEGLNWFAPDYVPRDHLLIEHYSDTAPTYCGIRTTDYMYARFHEPNGTYTQELYQEATDPTEVVNLANDPTYETVRAQMHDQAQAGCSPTPPGYGWGS